MPSKANHLHDNKETIRFAHGISFFSRFLYELTVCYFLLQSGKFGSIIVTRIDQSSLDIALVDSNHYGRFSRDINLAVVVGVGLFRSFAIEISDSRGDRIADQCPDVF